MRFAARRRLCRITFCLTCLLPTFLVGSAAVVVNTPAYRKACFERWRSQWSARLGVLIDLARVEQASADEFVIHQVALCDPESHRPLAQARSATIVRSAAGCRIRLGPTELDFDRLSRLVDILHEHLLLRAPGQVVPFQLDAATLNLQRETRPESILETEVVLEVTDRGTELLVAFRPPGSSGGDPVRLRIVRNRQIDPPATGWELHTGSTPLPCSLALAWLPELEQLGTECTFEGSVWCEQQLSGWEAELAGVFHRLDLDRLVTERFPHKLTGMAELEISDLTVRRGRVSKARGSLRCEGGVLSQSLLAAAEKHLGLKRYSPSPETMLLSYRDLSLEFSLDATRLKLTGCPGTEQVVLADSQGPLLASPEATTVAPQALVSLLVPVTDLDVPAARETAILLDALPLPAITPSARPSTARQYRPLRLRRE